MRGRGPRGHLALLACAAAALAASGCGGSGEPGSGFEEVRDAIQASLDERTVRNDIEFDFETDGESLSFGGTQVTDLTTSQVSGEFTYNDLPGVPDETRAELYSDGEDTFARYDFRPKEWLRLPPDPLSSIADVSSLIEVYETAFTEVEAEGESEVDGDETTLYSAEYELEQVLEILPEDDREAAETQLGVLDEETLDVDLHVGEDGLLRRFEVDLGPAIPADGATALVTIDFLEYGVPFDAEPPDPSEITSLDQALAAP